MNERERINYAKSELRNYKFLSKALKGATNRVEEVEAALENYKTSPFPLPGDGGGGAKTYRKAELFDKLEHRMLACEAIKFRVDAIEKFLESLDAEDRNIVENVYIDGERVDTVAIGLNYSIPGLVKKIDRIMLSF